MEKINLDSFELVQLKKRLWVIKVEYDTIFGENVSTTETLKFCKDKVEQNFYFSNPETNLNVIIGHLALFLNDIPYNNFSKVFEMETPFMAFMRENKLEICLN